MSFSLFCKMLRSKSVDWIAHVYNLCIVNRSRINKVANVRSYKSYPKYIHQVWYQSFVSLICFPISLMNNIKKMIYYIREALVKVHVHFTCKRWKGSLYFLHCLQCFSYRLRNSFSIICNLLLINNKNTHISII